MHENKSLRFVLLPLVFAKMPKCKLCDKSVYPMDPQINLDGNIFHKPCAKCADCKCQITLSNFVFDVNSSLLLCKTHHLKRFHESGSYLGSEKYQHKSDYETKAAERKASIGPASAIVLTSSETNDINNIPQGIVKNAKTMSKDSKVPVETTVPVETKVTTPEKKPVEMTSESVVESGIPETKPTPDASAIMPAEDDRNVVRRGSVKELLRKHSAKSMSNSNIDVEAAE